jgi:hypothetical protein
MKQEGNQPAIHWITCQCSFHHIRKEVIAAFNLKNKRTPKDISMFQAAILWN